MSPTAKGWRCGACGYPLSGDVVCPECGRRAGISRRRRGEGVRWRTRAAIAGRPLISVAWGRRGREPHGRAEGILACGDRARGIVALGTVATGPIAVGAVARGIVAFGGIALGGVSGGLLPIGVVAVGWVAVGYLAKGSAALGCYAGGGMVLARFSRIGDGPVPEDLPAIAHHLQWVFDSWPGAVLFPLILASVLVPGLTAGTSMLLRVAGRRAAATDAADADSSSA